MTVKYDLHIHTALSPCGDESMTPNNIVNMALLAGLDIIAVTDHNTCGNCRAVEEAGKRLGLPVISGMELTTSEEAHVLCLFPSVDEAERFEREVKRHQAFVENDADVFGRELYMDSDDNVVGEEKRLLIMATDIGCGGVRGLCEKYGGVAVPAHIDKDSYSLTSSLGYVDPDLGFKVCEVTMRCDIASLVLHHPELSETAFIRNSDAHDIGLIGLEPQSMEIERPSAECVIRFLKSASGGET